ncbi:MAG: hypothetical protein Kow0092_39760 [Deferrisomatales bacterium]
MSSPPAAYRRFRTAVALEALALSALVCAALRALLGSRAALGFALGGLGSVLTFHLHGADLSRLARLPASGARRRAGLSVLARTAIRGTALALAASRPDLSLGWAAAGLFVTPAISVLHHALAPSRGS